MKIKRHKHVRRVLQFYKINFNITEPYKILIDGTFAHEALQSKINLADQLPKFFDKSKCELLTTSCALQETAALGAVTHGAMLILKQYKIQPCKHTKSAVNTEKCFKSLLEGDKRFVVATQSESMKNIIRENYGTPLLIISHRALNLEKPTEVANKIAEETLKRKLDPSLDANCVLNKLLASKNNPQQQQPQHKRKKAKGPNPLSCKKKKKEPKRLDNNKKANVK